MACLGILALMARLGILALMLLLHFQHSQRPAIMTARAPTQVPTGPSQQDAHNHVLSGH